MSNPSQSAGISVYFTVLRFSWRAPSCRARCSASIRDGCRVGGRVDKFSQVVGAHCPAPPDLAGFQLAFLAVREDGALVQAENLCNLGDMIQLQGFIVHGGSSFLIGGGCRFHFS